MVFESIFSSATITATPREFRTLDYRSIQSYQAGCEETNTLRGDWKTRMISACALRYNGDIATVLRCIGGSHVNQLIDPSSILAKLKPILADDVFEDVERILTKGVPALCNAKATQENFEAYLKYGNHKSVKENPKVSESTTVIKQSKRGLTLMMNLALVHFTLNTHLIPQGLVDILHHRRKPKTSLRWSEAYAINDWTNKTNKPPLHFADEFQQFCIWHWNLAISHPQHDRHTGDDNVQCVFPRVK